MMAKRLENPPASCCHGICPIPAPKTCILLYYLPLSAFKPHVSGCKKFSRKDPPFPKGVLLVYSCSFSPSTQLVQNLLWLSYILTASRDNGFFVGDPLKRANETFIPMGRMLLLELCQRSPSHVPHGSFLRNQPPKYPQFQRRGVLVYFY